MGGRKITIRPATLDDARFVREHLRHHDRMELEAVAGSGKDLVSLSVAGSDRAYAAEADGEVFMLFGVGSGLISDTASVWALGTDRCNDLPFTMVRLGRKIVHELLDEYAVMENFVDDRYSASIRWLRLLGAHLGEPEPYGRDGKPFRRLLFYRGG